MLQLCNLYSVVDYHAYTRLSVWSRPASRIKIISSRLSWFMVSLQGTISLMHEIAGYIDWLSNICRGIYLFIPTIVITKFSLVVSWVWLVILVYKPWHVLGHACPLESHWLFTFKLKLYMSYAGLNWIHSMLKFLFPMQA